MKTTHTEFERYYQQVRSRQKRDAVCWSLLLLALYFAAGSALLTRIGPFGISGDCQIMRICFIRSG